MARIILNPDYVETGDVKQTGRYLFDDGGNTPPVDLVVWLEKSKANDKHPEGKPWIKLPKDNITNRAYFSEDLFIATQADGIVEVEIKTAAPRVLGATGVKQEIVKYLDEATATEYTELVENAVSAYKEAKGTSKKKRPEEMSAEELEAYITALRNGTKYTAAQGPKSFLDMFSEAQYVRYNELLALAAENKANAPKAARRPLTDEEKAVRAAKRQKTELSKAQALLDALRSGSMMDAGETVGQPDEDDEDFTDED